MPKKVRAGRVRVLWQADVANLAAVGKQDKKDKVKKEKSAPHVDPATALTALTESFNVVSQVRQAFQAFSAAEVISCTCLHMHVCWLLLTSAACGVARTANGDGEATQRGAAGIRATQRRNVPPAD